MLSVPMCLYHACFAVSFQWDSTVTDVLIVQQALEENSFGRFIFLLAVMRKAVCIVGKSALGKINLQVSFNWESYQNKSRKNKSKWFYDAFLLFSSPSLILSGASLNTATRPKKTSMLEMSRTDGFGRIWLDDKRSTKTTSRAAISTMI